MINQTKRHLYINITNGPKIIAANFKQPYIEIKTNSQDDNYYVATFFSPFCINPVFISSVIVVLKLTCTS